MHVTASTGIAAYDVGGTKTHSFTGIRKLDSDKQIANQILRIKTRIS